MAERDPERGDESSASYLDTKERTAEYQALLDKYDNDWEKAVEAQRRGEKVDTQRTGDEALPQ